MSSSLCLRGSASRLPLLFSLQRRATTVPSSPAPWPCRLRCNSTFSTTNIAALLSPSSLSPTSPQQGAPSGETLTINGFVRSVRKQKRVAFAAIGDGSTLKTVQAVFSPEQAEGSVENISP
jgi:asparaginyl-tRNA synthetase